VAPREDCRKLGGEGRRGEESKFTVVMSEMGVMCSYVAINMLGEMPKYVVIALGNIGFSVLVLVYVLPPMFYLVQFQAASMPWMLVSVGVLVAGIVLCGLSVIALVNIIFLSICLESNKLHSLPLAKDVRTIDK
jgi:hypothetical protein